MTKKIIIEGINGAGKSTIVDALYAFCEKIYDTEKIMHPSKTSLGNALRNRKIAPWIQEWVFEFDALCQKPSRKAEVIIEDRSPISRWVYQNVPIKKVEGTVFILDVPVNVALQRMHERKRVSKWAEGLEEKRQKYLKLAEIFPNVHVIDGTNYIECIVAEIVKIAGLRPVVYVAGPYRANTLTELVDNVNALRAAQIDLIRKGYSVINVIQQTKGLEVPFPTWDTDEWMAHDLPILAKCDAIYMVDGWEHSDGSIRELEFAKKMGIKVLKC